MSGFGFGRSTHAQWAAGITGTTASQGQSAFGSGAFPAMDDELKRAMRESQRTFEEEQRRREEEKRQIERAAVASLKNNMSDVDSVQSLSYHSTFSQFPSNSTASLHSTQLSSHISSNSSGPGCRTHTINPKSSFAQLAAMSRGGGGGAGSSASVFSQPTGLGRNLQPGQSIGFGKSKREQYAESGVARSEYQPHRSETLYQNKKKTAPGKPCARKVVRNRVTPPEPAPECMGMDMPSPSLTSAVSSSDTPSESDTEMTLIQADAGRSTASMSPRSFISIAPPQLQKPVAVRGDEERKRERERKRLEEAARRNAELDKHIPPSGFERFQPTSAHTSHPTSAFGPGDYERRENESYGSRGEYEMRERGERRRQGEQCASTSGYEVSQYEDASYFNECGYDGLGQNEADLPACTVGFPPSLYEQREMEERQRQMEWEQRQQERREEERRQYGRGQGRSHDENATPLATASTASFGSRGSTAHFGLSSNVPAATFGFPQSYVNQEEERRREKIRAERLRREEEEKGRKEQEARELEEKKRIARLTLQTQQLNKFRARDRTGPPATSPPTGAVPPPARPASEAFGCPPGSHSVFSPFEGAGIVPTSGGRRGRGGGGRGSVFQTSRNSTPPQPQPVPIPQPRDFMDGFGYRNGHVSAEGGGPEARTASSSESTPPLQATIQKQMTSGFGNMEGRPPSVPVRPFPLDERAERKERELEQLAESGRKMVAEMQADKYRNMNRGGGGGGCRHERGGRGGRGRVRRGGGGGERRHRVIRDYSNNDCVAQVPHRGEVVEDELVDLSGPQEDWPMTQARETIVRTMADFVEHEREMKEGRMWSNGSSPRPQFGEISIDTLVGDAVSSILAQQRVLWAGDAALLDMEEHPPTVLDRHNTMTRPVIIEGMSVVAAWNSRFQPSLYWDEANHHGNEDIFFPETMLEMEPLVMAAVRFILLGHKVEILLPPRYGPRFVAKKGEFNKRVNDRGAYMELVRLGVIRILEFSDEAEWLNNVRLIVDQTDGCLVGGSQLVYAFQKKAEKKGLDKKPVVAVPVALTTPSRSEAQLRPSDRLLCVYFINRAGGVPTSLPKTLHKRFFCPLEYSYNKIKVRVGKDKLLYYQDKDEVAMNVRAQQQLSFETQWHQLDRLSRVYELGVIETRGLEVLLTVGRMLRLQDEDMKVIEEAEAARETALLTPRQSAREEEEEERVEGERLVDVETIRAGAGGGGGERGRGGERSSIDALLEWK